MGLMKKSLNEISVVIYRCSNWEVLVYICVVVVRKIACRCHIDEELNCSLLTLNLAFETHEKLLKAVFCMMGNQLN